MQYLYNILYAIPGAMVAVTIHEYSKALASTRLGDQLPARRGRLTLNPLKHLEPIGFMFMLFYGFGWGKPTDTSPLYYRNREQGTLITYIVPTLINILLGLIFAMLLYIFKIIFITNINSYGEINIGYRLFIIVYRIIYGVAHCNLSLALFNIIPVYPLDAAKVLSLYLKPQQIIAISRYQSLVQLVLLLLIFVGVIGGILNPVIDLILQFAKI